MAAKFEVYKDKAGEFRFRLKAANGQNILSSEGYKTRQGVVKGIRSVQRNAENPDRFEKVTTKSGKFCFRLKAGNHHIIGVSQTYSSESGAINGIHSVKQSATTAAVDMLIEMSSDKTGSTGPKRTA